jgi:hypothetical protein
MAKKDITRDNTVEEFLKAYGATAVAESAKKLFVERLNALAETVATKAIAEASATAPAVVKVEASHLTKAFEGLGWSSSSGQLDAAGIIARLHQMPPEQIGALVRLIRDWLAAQPH